MSSGHLDNLNPEQKRAVSTLDGPVLILAGAGAGKTRTIAERIKHLIHSGIAPSKILAITFTNKAAREMRERVVSGLEQDLSLNRPVSMLERPFISTFHALGVHILREQSAKLNITKNFTIFDRTDSNKTIKEALTLIGLDPKVHEPTRLMNIISKEKGRGIDAELYSSSEDGGYLRNVIARVWPEYEKILKRENALDFDDLLLKTMHLLEKHPEVHSHYQDTWHYIHVDEYQDTNKVQYMISKMLVGDNKNICVVGDIDQNIYSWRGADIKIILDFEQDYPNTEVITLEENYRSTKTILAAANAVIEKNKIRRKKNLFTDNVSGEKIGLNQSFDEINEAEFIATKTAEIIKMGTPPEEIAVLYRANFQSRVLEETFMAHDIPYQLLGTRFFDRKEIKDIISYLRAALNPDSISDLKRIINIPARGIGKTTILKIFSGDEASLPDKMKTKIHNFRNLLSKIEKISKEKLPSETITFVIKATGMEEEWKNMGEEGAARLENAYELVNLVSRYNHLPPTDGVLNFLSDAALQSDQDEIRDENKSVRLMTVHASKGLEFDTVFVSGLEDGLFPHQRANEDGISPGEAEEERRLFYVALTRAKKKLFLSYAETRTLFGRRQVNIPSEFIFDIPEALIENEVGNEFGQSRKPLLEIDF